MTSPFFDATAHKPATGAPEPLPVGTYPVAVTAAERKDNEKGWGLKVVLTVLDGQYQGRQIYEQFNLSHTSADTVRIAQEQFSALCHVVNVLKPRDPSELLNLPFQVKVKIDPPKNPWNADLWSGASSSGSGVATAAGLCFGSLGTDTGGSIRQPASVTGTVGVKPTYGGTSRYGVVAMASSLDTPGPCARTVP